MDKFGSGKLNPVLPGRNQSSKLIVSLENSFSGEVQFSRVAPVSHAIDAMTWNFHCMVNGEKLEKKIVKCDVDWASGRSWVCLVGSGGLRVYYKIVEGTQLTKGENSLVIFFYGLTDVFVYWVSCWIIKASWKSDTFWESRLIGDCIVFLQIKNINK